MVFHIFHSKLDKLYVKFDKQAQAGRFDAEFKRTVEEIRDILNKIKSMADHKVFKEYMDAYILTFGPNDKMSDALYEIKQKTDYLLGYLWHVEQGVDRKVRCYEFLRGMKWLIEALDKARNHKTYAELQEKIKSAAELKEAMDKLESL
jgi:soluble cytochrome b562